ncbi:alpha/beta fold hydrolase [Wenjunlia tyrosinilytica]|uniref:Thioesterase TesA-like domain-containing protein n=1 Tax=Wenjunlia tyrosinilytica TaxID=1544741 RepID=A0A917ZTS3_9ACTN|nr:alpha/beta fold hydrolase [Wenjunlia tyrosinilytica]GGO92418.1 hypothetical protein GCM10012280_42550 [Wenjunlia tyrosinilytica]
MRPRRRQPAAPQIVRRLRTAAPGGRTVFLVHPGALPADVHRALAAALPEGSGLTVLDLSAVPEYFDAALAGGRADTTLEALAAKLRAEFEALPEGPVHDGRPYVLAGWSFGGVLALEMARQMSEGRRPRRLVLLDSIAPTQAYQQPDEALDPPLLLGWFAMYLGAKRQRRIRVFASRLAGHSAEDGLLQVLDAAVAAGALSPDTPMPGLRKLYDTYVDGLLRNNRLTAPYRPGPAHAPIVLIKAEGSLIPEDPTLGWEELAPHGLELHTAPGDHYTMLARQDSAEMIARLVGVVDNPAVDNPAVDNPAVDNPAVDNRAVGDSRGGDSRADDSVAEFCPPTVPASRDRVG